MHAPSALGGRTATQRPRASGSAAALTVLLLGTGIVAGCAAGVAASPAASPAAGSRVTVLATWSGPELAAFQAVVAPFETQTGIAVDYTATNDLRGELDERIADGRLPDIAGLVGPDHMADLARAGVLRDLGGALDLGRYRQQTAPAFVSLGMVDDRLVGAFLKATLKGLVWFDPRDNRLGVPDSWDDLLRTALRFSTDTTRPWCVGLGSTSAPGWPGTDWIEAILLRESGRRAYDQWVSGSLPWSSPEVRGAFARYLDVVADQSVAGGAAAAADTDFRVAADGPFRDPPSCLYTMGASFTPAFFSDGGMRPGSDYDFFPLPAIDERNATSMEVAGDLFGLFSDRPEAAQLMAWLVSRDAQRIWVQDGAALSGNIGVTEYPDSVTRHEASLLTSASDIRFDASDQMGEGVAHAFLAAVLRVTADPTSLDSALAGVDAVRTGLGRGAP